MNLNRDCQKCWGCLHICKWSTSFLKWKIKILKALSLKYSRKKTVKVRIFIQHRSEVQRTPVHTKFHRCWHLLLNGLTPCDVLWIILDDFIIYYNTIAILYYLVRVPSMYVFDTGAFFSDCFKSMVCRTHGERGIPVFICYLHPCFPIMKI